MPPWLFFLIFIRLSPTPRFSSLCCILFIFVFAHSLHHPMLLLFFKRLCLFTVFVFLLINRVTNNWNYTNTDLHSTQHFPSILVCCAFHINSGTGFTNYCQNHKLLGWNMLTITFIFSSFCFTLCSTSEDFLCTWHVGGSTCGSAEVLSKHSFFNNQLIEFVVSPYPLTILNIFSMRLWSGELAGQSSKCSGIGTFGSMGRC